MTPADARQILLRMGAKLTAATIDCGGFSYCVGNAGERNTVCLDGDFTPDELEAIAMWMRYPLRVSEPTIDG